MANTYGDDTEPGIITEETSASNIISSDDAPSDACIVGPADLANATDPATENTVYEITRDTTAINRFGEDSLLTEAVLDMLLEGAAPVYAVATTATDVVDEDHGTATTTTVSLTNTPTSEDAADFTVTLGGTDLTVIMTHEDVSTTAPAAGECYVNPVDAEVEVPSAPDTTTGMLVDYTWYDYTAALDEVETNIEAAEAIDFLAAVQENATVQQDVEATADTMSTNQHYTVAFVAPNAVRINPSDYTNTYDSSRVQVIYATRYTDGTSALASYMGMRADIGLSRTAIGRRFENDKQLAVTLTRSERGALIDQRVVPLENRVGGIEVKDDKTSVSANNTEEANIDFGFKRLVLDYLYETAEENERPFVGRLNHPHVRNALQDLIAEQLTAMKSSNIIESYSVRVFEDTATQARLELNVVAPDPLRFIKNDVSVGSSA